MCLTRALMLGVCDKIVPGPLDWRSALRPLAHGVCARWPHDHVACPTTKSPRCASKRHRAWWGGPSCWQAESKAYHGPGTCTFYGTANSNQMLLEAMGLHVPGTAFINPGDGVRDELTREAVRTVLALVKDKHCTPIGRVVDERCHRERHGGFAGHGRLDQPPDPLGGGGAGGGHRASIGTIFRPCRMSCLC